ncbi:rho guanine nucleotide exchange factor 28 isoform X2 [Polypterus senegalus]|uniref:rho guanine nucleotide exchange factor 28 isoform X2 n=1 Tax=Polypterus senegalus TaxID=55291 RepID=UPI001963FD43|nr:rho guanine nucleotide exchange factor 28 isoform X2 [Polypterus senegalus]
MYEGSSQDHITEAKRADGNTLEFLVPGHNIPENVTVTAYANTGDNSICILGKSSLKYINNDIVELAQFLVDNSHCLTTESHLTLISRFGMRNEVNENIDQKIVLALSHLELPFSWNILGNHPVEEVRTRESLLHLSVRLGWFHLTQFLLCQPGGLIALSLPSEEGVTPVQLAIQNGHEDLVQLLQNPPNPLVTPLAGISHIQTDSYSLLKFCHLTKSLTLTIKYGMERTVESSIGFLRKNLKDNNFLRELEIQKPDWLENKVQNEDLKTKCIQVQDFLHDGNDGSHEQLNNALMPPVDDKDGKTTELGEDNSSSLSDAFKKNKDRPTFSAAARLSAMLNAKDEIYANSMVVEQVNDLNIKYSSHEVNSGASQQEKNASDQGEMYHLQSADQILEEMPSTSNHNLGHFHENMDLTDRDTNTEIVPPISPVNLALQRLNMTHRTHGFNQGGSQCDSKINKQSHSSDGLDCNSEEEDNVEGSLPFDASPSPKSTPVQQTSSGDELDYFEISPEYGGNRNRSISSANKAFAKELMESGLRLRSYSYSSPKVSMTMPNFIRDSGAASHTEEHRTYSLPEHPKEKRIEEEEWDKYIIPSKTESEKYKVSRTFSFLKNRMSGKRDKKGKNKEKDGKDKLIHGHQFVSGSFSGPTLCLVCDKTIIGKELFQCSNCTINIHKQCKESVAPCIRRLSTSVKNKPVTTPQSSSAKDVPLPSPPTNSWSSTIPIGISKDTRRESYSQNNLHSKNAFGPFIDRKSNDIMDSDVDNNSSKSWSQSEEMLQVIGTSPCTDTFPLEDMIDSPLRNDIMADTVEYEAESWSLAVEPEFCSKQEKSIIKRQDVIYELMQTEMHHIQTLMIMSEIFRKGMKEEVQLDHCIVDRIFPCLDELFEIHKSFFSLMTERRQESMTEDSDRNFVIDRIGDILLQQFSEESAVRMKQVYGEFCSHHIDAVNFFKELQQQNKKFNSFIKQQSNNFLVRRREIPECILLVTQRLTKYPVLLERILKYSKEGSDEHADLTKSLGLVKDIIAAVDLKVNEYEKEQKLLEILSKIDNKTFARLKKGNFRKHDLMNRKRVLHHEGVVFWKTATGRLKDILALLLTDVLIFLQEKDQKYVFAAVDQKPPVIPLQKLIVREVANEERGMFLISASTSGPEMYEIHTNTKEERNTWMRLIREAVESCPQEEDKEGETEEDRQMAEARIQKIHKYQESLHSHDEQICQSLEEKLNIYSKLTALNFPCQPVQEQHLLIKPDPEEVPQAAALLTTAIKEAERLLSTLTLESFCSEESIGVSDSSVKLQDSESCESIPEFPHESVKLNAQSSSSLTSEFEVREGELSYPHQYVPEALNEFQPGGLNHLELKVAQSVQSLLQLIYSLQAAVTIQDSCFEVQKLLLQETERLPRYFCGRGNLLLEQGRQRNMEKHREELASVQQLQSQLRQEQQRWERECSQLQRQQVELDNELEQRERNCVLQTEQLRRDREDLENQLKEYQQNLERLREGQQLVEKDREELDKQQAQLHGWKHKRQSSLPVMITFPLAKTQVPSHTRKESLDVRGCGSIYVNEAAFQMSLNNHPESSTSVPSDTSSVHNSLNSLIAEANNIVSDHRTEYLYQPQISYNANAWPSCTQQWIPTHPVTPLRGDLAGPNNDISGHMFDASQSMPGQSVASSLSQQFSQSSAVKLQINQQTYISVEPENGLDGSEENIVYL